MHDDSSAESAVDLSDKLSPPEIVRELDRFVIAQDNAKRAVATALRNRWRRMQVKSPLREEIVPKNLILSPRERRSMTPLHATWKW